MCHNYYYLGSIFRESRLSRCCRGSTSFKKQSFILIVLLSTIGVQSQSGYRPSAGNPIAIQTPAPCALFIHTSHCTVAEIQVSLHAMLCNRVKQCERLSMPKQIKRDPFELILHDPMARQESNKLSRASLSSGSAPSHPRELSSGV